MSTPGVIVHPGSGLLAKAAAARIVTRLIDAQTARGSASIVLTGGSIGIAVLAELARAPARDAINWPLLDVWWGDERFLPTGDPDRNETQAREALLDRVGVAPERVHPMPASDGPDGDAPERGAERYAAALADATRSRSLRTAVPRSSPILIFTAPTPSSSTQRRSWASDWRGS